MEITARLACCQIPMYSLFCTVLHCTHRMGAEQNGTYPGIRAPPAILRRRLGWRTVQYSSRGRSAGTRRTPPLSRTESETLLKMKNFRFIFFSCQKTKSWLVKQDNWLFLVDSLRYRKDPPKKNILYRICKGTDRIWEIAPRLMPRVCLFSVTELWAAILVVWSWCLPLWQAVTFEVKMQNQAFQFSFPKENCFRWTDQKIFILQFFFHFSDKYASTMRQS